MVALATGFLGKELLLDHSLRCHLHELLLIGDFPPLSRKLAGNVAHDGTDFGSIDRVAVDPKDRRIDIGCRRGRLLSAGHGDEKEQRQ